MTKPFAPVPFRSIKKSTSSNLGNPGENPVIASCAMPVAIREILRDKSLQVRQRVDPRVVRKYAEAMQAGAEFPPVVLAHIDGSLYLVDGWHRVEATLLNDQHLILSLISEMTLDEACWQAAKANTVHGLPLKTKELREVFRAFIDTRQHEQVREKLMPYREIAKRIGKGFSTIRNWMKADYPMLFRKYQQMANGTLDGGERDREDTAMQRRLTTAVAGGHNVRNIGRTLGPGYLGELISTLQETLSDLETNPYHPVRPPEF